jgi:hypothetical protein
LTVTDSQLAALTALRAEIERIDRATREPAAAAEPRMDAAMSYSFGMFSGPEQTIAEIVASVHTTLARLTPVTTLETSKHGLTARTVINYTGRAASVWSNSPSSELAALLSGAHLDSLQKSYALRAAFAEAIAAVGSTLVSISVAVANPLTVLHALASANALKQALERLAIAVEAAG